MPTSKESLTPHNETTSKAESHDAQTLKQGSDPHLQENTPSENETTSKSESHDAQTLKQGSDRHLQEKTPSETAYDNKSQKEQLPEVPKTTKWKIFKNYFWGRRKSPAKSYEGPPPRSDPNVTESSVKSKDDPASLSGPKAVSNLIQADVEYMEEGARNLWKYSERLNLVVRQVSSELKELKKEENGAKEKNLHEMRKSIIKVKLQIPPKFQAELYENLELKTQAKRTIPDEVLDIIPQLHNDGVFQSRVEFKDFEARYNNLDLRLKLCLLCFSIFPENAIIRKRLMLQWWVAEGFVDEDDANKRFMELIKKGFIEPVNDNKSLDIGRCKIYPFYRSALITLAKRAKFFKFYEKGLPTQNFKGSFQACLVGEGLISYDDLVYKEVTIDDLEKIHLLMNVKEQTLDFKDEWFAKMVNVNLLHLGTWGVSPEDHIEVEDRKFLEGFVNMQYMKFLSLQGVSNIFSLPESLLQLTNLNILDLRACHNLETLPEGIGLLKSLTHLDMSKCYLLTHMPQSLSQLMMLKVLEGFVVGDEKGKSSCKLDDLRKLENLIKLSIYTELPAFPEEEHVQALEKLKELKRLSITWGGEAITWRGEVLRAENEKKGTKISSNTTSNGLKSTGKLPSNLEKLDLKCFPMSKTPNWLELNNLKELELKKLYIRGGKFSDLGQYQDWNANKHTWKVEVLRLKYLSEIEVEWTQLQELFPHLVYLEQVSCPKLTFAPCDANGVWINQSDQAKLKALRGIVP